VHTNIRRAAAAAGAAALTLSVGIASALGSSGPRAHGAQTHIVKTVGGEIFKPNVSDTMTMRFAPANIKVHPGDTIVFEHADKTHDPHTISVVAAKDLPRSSDPCPACARVEKAHFPHGQSGPPLPVVNVGKPGLDQPGDSIVWMGGKVSAKVSAPAGTVLHYFCAIHPWMQGTITVVK
jgi:plastocyanin